MLTKRYFEVKQYERKWVAIDFATHMLIQIFARERGLSMAEAVHVLTAPALAALNGLDYEKVLRGFELIQKTDTPDLG